MGKPIVAPRWIALDHHSGQGVGVAHRRVAVRTSPALDQAANCPAAYLMTILPERGFTRTRNPRRAPFLARTTPCPTLVPQGKSLGPTHNSRTCRRFDQQRGKLVAVTCAVRAGERRDDDEVQAQRLQQRQALVQRGEAGRGLVRPQHLAWGADRRSGCRPAHPRGARRPASAAAGPTTGMNPVEVADTQVEAGAVSCV